MQYRAGDRVRVVSHRPRGAEETPPTWVDSMDDYLGKTGTVELIDGDNFLYIRFEPIEGAVGDTGWWFHRDWLEDNLPAGTVPTWESRIYLGSRERYDGPLLDRSRIIQTIELYQKSADEEMQVSVRITPTTYIFQDYVEDGWEVGIINYPRFPRTESRLTQFTISLGSFLLNHLKQNRISLVMPNRTILLESEDAQENPPA